MTRIVPLAPLAALAILSGCASDDPVAFGKWTERRTTASLDYNEVARSTLEAQTEVRDMCGEAEVMSVSQPVLLENGLFRVTAECLATYDGAGRLIPNAPQT